MSVPSLETPPPAPAGPPGLNPTWDLIVIGAGPAGLLGATRAAELGLRVLLIEKNRKPGVKILMSGGTRCNLTQATDARGIVEAFGPQGPFLHSALARFSPADLVELIEAEGVPTKREPTGKIFPASDRALDVQQALLRRLHRSGATLQLGVAVQEIVFEEQHRAFLVATESGPVSAQRVLVTTGGLSYPGCGTTGDGYHWAERLGHTVTPRAPSLVPLRSDQAWVQALSGLTLPDAAITLEVDGDERGSGARPRRSVGRDRASDRGGLLFTHFGFSGPAPLNVSRTLTLAPPAAQGRLICDFAPTYDRTALDGDFLKRIASDGRRGAGCLVDDLLPSRLGDAVLAQAGLVRHLKLAEIGRVRLRALVEAIKASPVPLSGALGYEKAEVTAGGVALAEVNSRTMESRCRAGLYFAGEILDLDGPIGGFNFQAAFSTAWLAAEAMAAGVSGEWAAR